MDASQAAAAPSQHHAPTPASSTAAALSFAELPQMQAPLLQPALALGGGGSGGLVLQSQGAPRQKKRKKPAKGCARLPEGLV